MSSTMITNPSASMPSSGRGSGAVTGAAQGAAAGTAIMPGVGTVVGAVIGGIAGFLGGSEQDKAQRHASLAYKWASMQKMREAAIARRDKVREFRMLRANAILGITQEEGGRRSSAPQGSVSSLQGQYAFNMNYFDTSAYIQSQYQKHANKAGKHAASANMIMSTIGAVSGVVGSIGSTGIFSPKPPSAPTPTTGGTSTGTTYSPSWKGPR